VVKRELADPIDRESMSLGSSSLPLRTRFRCYGITVIISACHAEDTSATLVSTAKYAEGQPTSWENRQQNRIRTVVEMPAVGAKPVHPASFRGKVLWSHTRFGYAGSEFNSRCPDHFMTYKEKLERVFAGEDELTCIDAITMLSENEVALLNQKIDEGLVFKDSLSMSYHTKSYKPKKISYWI
jgi:hypothetical protein